MAYNLDNLSPIARKHYDGRTILVTGGAGFIGHWVVRALLDLGANVKVVDNFWRGIRENLNDTRGQCILESDNLIDGDLRDPEMALEVCKDVDSIIHLADIVAGIGWVFSNQRSLFRDNILINTNVYEAVAQNKIESLVYVGTACSFPQQLQTENSRPLREEDTYPAHPESAYGWSKLMGEYEAELLAQETSTKVAILRLHNVYGPESDFGEARSQVIPSLIRKAIAYPSEPFVVWGSGNQARSFIYVGDVVEALLSSLVYGLNQGCIQIGTSDHVTIRSVAEEVVSISGKNIKIDYDTSRPEGDAGRCADWSKAKRILGWEPRTPIHLGLKQTYESIESVINT